MPFYFFHWDDESIEHIAQHGLTPEEFEHIVSNPRRTGLSRTTGRPIAYGYSDEGILTVCVFEYLDEDTIIPITAYEPEN